VVVVGVVRKVMAVRKVMTVRNVMAVRKVMVMGALMRPIQIGYDRAAVAGTATGTAHVRPPPRRS